MKLCSNPSIMSVRWSRPGLPDAVHRGEQPQQRAGQRVPDADQEERSIGIDARWSSRQLRVLVRGAVCASISSRLRPRRDSRGRNAAQCGRDRGRPFANEGDRGRLERDPGRAMDDTGTPSTCCRTQDSIRDAGPIAPRISVKTTVWPFRPAATTTA